MSHGSSLRSLVSGSILMSAALSMLFNSVWEHVSTVVGSSLLIGRTLWELFPDIWEHVSSGKGSSLLIGRRLRELFAWQHISTIEGSSLLIARRLCKHFTAVWEHVSTVVASSLLIGRRLWELTSVWEHMSNVVCSFLIGRTLGELSSRFCFVFTSFNSCGPSEPGSVVPSLWNTKTEVCLSFLRFLRFASLLSLSLQSRGELRGISVFSSFTFLGSLDDEAEAELEALCAPLGEPSSSFRRSLDRDLERGLLFVSLVVAGFSLSRELPEEEGPEDLVEDRWSLLGSLSLEQDLERGGGGEERDRLSSSRLPSRRRTLLSFLELGRGSRLLDRDLDLERDRGGLIFLRREDEESDRELWEEEERRFLLSLDLDLREPLSLSLSPPPCLLPPWPEEERSVLPLLCCRPPASELLDRERRRRP